MTVMILVIGFVLGAISAAVFFYSLGRSDGVAPKKSFPIIGVFLLVPVLAGLIYWKVGTPDAISTPVAQQTPVTHEPNDAGHNMGDLEAMAQKLADKLEKTPENGDGWALLAHTYVEINQHAKAVVAFEKATQLITHDPQLFADYADAQAVANGGSFDEKTQVLVERALKIDEKHQKALWLAGTISFNQKKYSDAIGYWERLQIQLKDDQTGLLKEVTAGIAEARNLKK